MAACYGRARRMVETALTTHMQGLRQTEDLIYQEYGTTEEMGEDGRRIPSRRSYGLQRIWYASKMEGARLAGLLLLEVSPSGYVHRVVVGDAAEWQMDESTWKFSNSTVLDVSPVGSTRRILQMDGLRVPSAPLTSGRAFRKRSLRELSRSEIVSEITRLQSSNGTDRVVDGKMLNKLECFLCQRDAAAFSCVVYGLIGALATLAPSGRGSSRATPFAWAIVSTLIFSATVAVAMALGSTGALNPWWSAWLPPLLGLSVIVLVIFGPSELQQQQLRKLASHGKELGEE